LKALELDERCGLAWHVLAIAREKLGDLNHSLNCYQAALDLLPDPEVVAADLGRLAYRLEMKDLAEVLFRRVVTLDPNATEAANNLACTLKDLGRASEAIDVLKDAIGRNGTDPGLWNTLGTVVAEQGDVDTAIIFYTEALNHDPNFAKASYNLGNAKLLYGDLDGALADCNAALAMQITPDEAAMMRLARSTIQLCRGNLQDGWEDYEARLDPLFSGGTQFAFDRPKWSPGAAVWGKSVLVIGEQGLGDEVLFASVLPNLLKDVGPEGQVTLAIEPRLVPLFSRSFPDVRVGHHETYGLNQLTIRLVSFVDKPDEIDYWVPLASLLRQYRTNIESFPRSNPFLVADPERVEYWRNQMRLIGPGPKVGILWKSLKMAGARNNAFSPFELWRPILRTPGIQFINIQYGECDDELAWAKSELGVNIWTPPGIDLKTDLDDVAALTCALDLTISFANATSNIAAACGNPVWMMSAPGAWTRLGTDSMPWYPSVKGFVCSQPGDWAATMDAVAGYLASHF
jgi:Tfp pilus assembly protein PilF